MLEMHQIIELANGSVYTLSQSSEGLKGMGTTLCCLYVHTKEVIYAHVGDSRIYRLREKKLCQLTCDHSLVEEWRATPALASYAAALSADDIAPLKRVITRAIGVRSRVAPSISSSDLRPGDLFLLCSDGLTDCLSVIQLQDILNADVSLEEKARLLVQSAKDNGGFDNITVVLVKC
jgi:protein phosphatase